MPTGAGAQGQDDPEDRTIQAMCRVGLTTSAVEYVTARRKLVSGDPSQLAKWTMRLMECHAFSALHASSEAAGHWQTCQDVMQQFQAANPQNARLPWLAWQACRCQLLEAQANLARYLAAPAKLDSRDRALEIVRDILGSLDTLEDDIRQRQPLAARQRLNDGAQAPAEQLNQLSVDAVLLRCEALLVRSRLYKPQSTDRIAAAAEVDQQITDALQRTSKDWPARDMLLVAQAIAQLELGQAANAVQKLERLALESSQRQARIRAMTNAISYLAANRNDSRARVLVNRLAEEDAGPEMELAKIELALSQIRSTPEQQKHEMLSQLIAQSKQIGARYGDYWQRRSEALLLEIAPADSLDPDSQLAYDLVLVEVRQLLAADQFQAAIDRLLVFRDNEAAAGRGASAIKVATQAAALHQHQQAWLPAADILEPIACQFSSEEAAAAAHLQALFCVSQALRTATSNDELRQKYTALLLQQLQKWPDASASEEAQAWLTTWLNGQQRQHELATALFQRAAHAENQQVVQTVWLHWLEAVLSIPDPQDRKHQLQTLDQAVSQNRFTVLPNLAPQVHVFAESVLSWPESQVMQVRLRQLAEWSKPDDPAQIYQLSLAIRILHAVRSQDNPGDWQVQLAEWQPEQLSSDAIRGVLAVALIEALDELPNAAQTRWLSQLKFTGGWSEQLLASPIARFQAAGYRVLAWLDSPAEGLAGLEKLAQQASRGGGELQLQLANALAASGPNRFEESSGIAKRLIANSPPSSELNLAARWRLLKNQLLAGQSAEAQTAAQLLLATQVIESDVWRRRFERVAGKL